MTSGLTVVSFPCGKQSRRWEPFSSRFFMRSHGLQSGSFPNRFGDDEPESYRTSDAHVLKPTNFQETFVSTKELPDAPRFGTWAAFSADKGRKRRIIDSSDKDETASSLFFRQRLDKGFPNEGPSVRSDRSNPGRHAGRDWLQNPLLDRRHGRCPDVRHAAFRGHAGRTYTAAQPPPRARGLCAAGQRDRDGRRAGTPLETGNGCVCTWGSRTSVQEYGLDAVAFFVPHPPSDKR